MTLAQTGDGRLLSVEFGGGQVSTRKILTRGVHANHALHLDHPDQIATRSSADRQKTGERLARDGMLSGHDILRVASGPGLPIRRDDPFDPDAENTLAISLFDVSGSEIGWKIFSDRSDEPTYRGTCKTD